VISVRSLIFPLFACSIGAYFGYSLQNSDHGLKARAELEAKKAVLQGELAGLKEVRAQLQHDVSLLRPESLDPDMLDERARAILNMARPDEIVMLKRQPPTVKFMPLTER
jgi:cell division protein FtsB